MTPSLVRELTAHLRCFLDRCSRQAERRRPSGLVSTTVKLPRVDPLAVFDGGAPAERALWEQPAEDTSMVAVGTAARLTGRGADRFREIIQAWRRLTASAVLEGDEPAPLPQPVCLGGFAFDPMRSHDRQWQGYGDALLVIPTFLLVSRPDSSWLTVNAMVGSDSDVPATMDTTVRALHHLLARDGPVMRREATEVFVDQDAEASRWKETVAAVIQSIRRGAVEKLVLARQVGARCPGRLDPTPALRRLRSVYRNCTIFAFATGESCFIGATPERLVRLRGRLVQTTCLAGSTARGATGEDDVHRGERLLGDAKERREHALVVGAVRDVLLRFCPRLEAPASPVLLRMPNIQHICTPLEGLTQRDVHVLELVERLHPTPAAGGLPREAALRLIRAYEPFDRGWYGGPVGWIGSDGSGDIAVAIRSALLRGNEAFLYAGCGIVDGSNPQREYEEVCLKLRSMLWALGAQ